jgi:hypothetical protein
VKKVKFAILLYVLLLVSACGGSGDGSTNGGGQQNDTVPPSITINSPTSDENFTATSGTISIAGVSSDNVGVVNVFWETDDGQSGTATGTNNWQVDSIALVNADTQIRVIAVDNAGNDSTDLITVSVQSGADIVAPTISITSPTDEATFTTSASSIAIAGVSDDNVGVVSVSWETDDGQSGTATGTSNWQVGSISLAGGNIQIRVIAVDSAGNQGVDVITITVQSAGVTVSIQSPTSASTFSTNSSEITLSGNASSTTGSITEVTWSNTQGQSGNASGTSSWTTPQISVAVGSNSITISAQDDQGSVGDDTLQVTRGGTGTGFVEGKDTTPPSATQTEPAFGNSYVDPAYGLTVRKMTDASGTRFNRNIYSRLQPENSNATLFITYHGESEYRIYDRQTLALVRALPTLGPQSEIQWHPSNPRRIRYTTGGNSFDGSLQLLELDIDDPQGTAGSVLLDLTGRLPWPDVDPQQGGTGFISDGAEGSPSRDGNRYAWVVVDRFEAVVGIVSVDISTDTILGTLGAASFAQFGEVDHVSMTPSGNAIVASYDLGSIAYDIDFSNPRQLHHTTEHSDIAINAQGRDTFVIINFQSGDLMMVDVQTAQSTNLFNIFQENTDTSLHISGKAFDKPGWVVMSSYNCRAQPGWACNKVIAVELAANPRILNLAHTYNCGMDFWTEPHAVPSRDLRRVYYNSDWDSCAIDAEVMMIDVPDF